IIAGATGTAEALATPTPVRPTMTLRPNQITATALVAWATQTAAARIPTLPPTRTLTPHQMTVTAIVSGATAAAQGTFTVTPVMPAPSATGNPILLTATAIIAQASQTAQAFQPTPTPRPTLRPTRTPTPTPTETPDWEATATAIVASATAAAQRTPSGAVEDGAARFTLGPDDEITLRLTVPEGWPAPDVLDTHTLYLTDDTAQIFIYTGDAAYFENTWQIPADADFATEAAVAVQTNITGGTLTAYASGTARVARILLDDGAGAVYVIHAGSNEWLILSASVPPDEFEDYQTDVFEPLIASLDVDIEEIAMPTPTSSPTAIPASQTPVSVERYESDELGLAFEAPRGWDTDLERSDFVAGVTLNAVLFYSNSDDVEVGEPSAPALSVVRMDGTVTSVRTPRDLLQTMLGNDLDQIESYAALDYPAARGTSPDTIELPAIVYALQLTEDDWLMVLLVAPGAADQLPRLEETVLLPLLHSLEVSEAGPPTAPPTRTPEPSDTPSPTPTPVS
ncbi:MAG: hypothetical protein GX573_05410, partial [Chloroflexi bacterium]|nr:hypothetical protein [Chloroflexota bacterium]